MREDRFLFYNDGNGKWEFWKLHRRFDGSRNHDAKTY